MFGINDKEVIGKGVIISALVVVNLSPKVVLTYWYIVIVEGCPAGVSKVDAKSPDKVIVYVVSTFTLGKLAAIVVVPVESNTPDVAAIGIPSPVDVDTKFHAAPSIPNILKLVFNPPEGTLPPIGKE